MPWPRLKPSIPRSPGAEIQVKMQWTRDVWYLSYLVIGVESTTSCIKLDTKMILDEDHRCYKHLQTRSSKRMCCFPGSSAKQRCQRSCSKGTKGRRFSKGTKTHRKLPLRYLRDNTPRKRQVKLMTSPKTEKNTLQKWCLEDDFSFRNGILLGDISVHFPRCSTLQEAESRVEELEALLLQERRERQKEKEACFFAQLFWKTDLQNELWSLYITVYYIKDMILLDSK